MQAFKEAKAGVKPPGVFKTLVGVFSEVRTANNLESSLHNYRGLWRGLGAQLARDVPFSAICWSTLEPVRSLTCLSVLRCRRFILRQFCQIQ
jgi:solute carrier family 25 protein 39/40